MKQIRDIRNKVYYDAFLAFTLLYIWFTPIIVNFGERTFGCLANFIFILFSSYLFLHYIGSIFFVKK